MCVIVGVPLGNWPELFPFLVQLTKSPNELQRRCGLNIFGGVIQVAIRLQC
jgi:hypothetical protein